MPFRPIESILLLIQTIYLAARMKYTLLFKVGIGLTLLLFAWSLRHRAPDIDDAWIGEHAYWMAENGFVKSELMHGITDQHIRHIVHHKLFTLNGALFIKLIGFSLPVLKSVSLCWLIIFVLIYVQHLKTHFDPKTLWVALFVFLINGMVFQFGFVYRPEIMAMTLGFISYLFLLRVFNTASSPLWMAILSGLFAGLAIATHLNGLIYIAAGGGLLLLNRQVLPAIVLGLASLLTASIYFYDFTAEFGFEFWQSQLMDSPALHNSEIHTTPINFIFKPLMEHFRYFHSPKEIFLSLTLLSLLAFNFKGLQQHKKLFTYWLLLAISLSFISVHSTSKYLLLLMPWMVLIISKLITALPNPFTKSPASQPLPAKKWPPYIVTLAFAGYVVFNLLWAVQIANAKVDPYANRAFVEAHIPGPVDSLNILAPMDLIFNEIKNFNRIQGDLSFSDIQRSNPAFKGLRILDHALNLDLDYLIIKEEFREKFGVYPISEEARQKAGYETIESTPDFEILRRIKG